MVLSRGARTARQSRHDRRPVCNILIPSGKLSSPFTAPENMTSNDDVSKYLFVEGKGSSDGKFINPIGAYIMKNSLREPDILRRLQEVNYLLFIPIKEFLNKAGWFLTVVKLYTETLRLNTLLMVYLNYIKELGSKAMVNSNEAFPQFKEMSLKMTITVRVVVSTHCKNYSSFSKVFCLSFCQVPIPLQDNVMQISCGSPV